MASQEGTPSFSTLSIVPPGFNWKPEAAQKAKDKGAFLRVGGKQITRRFLSGAKRAWASTNPDDRNSIYNVTYRITGTPQNVAQALSFAGYDQNAINQAVNDSITSDNFNTTKAIEYNNEIASRDLLKKSQKTQADSGYNWSQLTWFAQNIKSAAIQTKSGEARGGVVSPGRRKDNDLKSRVEKLGVNEVLDVSGMDINTGTGARKTERPRTNKAGKYGINEIPIISNNIDTYVAALRMIYGEEAVNTYRAAVDVVRSALLQHGTKPATTQLGNIPTPGSVQLAGAALSGVPTFVPMQPAPGANLAPLPNLIPSVLSPPVGNVGTIGGATLSKIPAYSNIQQQ